MAIQNHIDEDKFLLKQIHAGNKKAFDKLFCKYYKGLCAMARQYVADKATAEDIVQEFFLEFYQKNKIEIHTSVKSYIYKSVYYKCIAFQKKIKIGIDSLEFESEVHFSETNLEQFELERKIHETIEMLPPQCKKVFILSRFEEMKYKEIAEHLNISIKAVEAHVSKALKILSTSLVDYLPLLFSILLFK